MMRLRPLAAVASLLFGACTGAAVPEPDQVAGYRLYAGEQTRQDPAPASTTGARPQFAGFTSTYQGDVALAAFAGDGVAIYETPGDGRPVLTLPPTTIIGTTTVLGLTGEPGDGWAEVRLPLRPNGTTGWVRTADVELFVVSGEIVVDLSERTLIYSENQVEVLQTQVAVGSDRSPTPVGQFYVTDSVTLTKTGTPWGTHALGLSARSEHVTEFNGGDGIIGIHGTSHPSSIGQAVSLGCVRLHNDVIAKLHALVPVGTPVEIRA